MTFEEFVASDLRNQWIKEPSINIYVRRSLPFRKTDFDLANANARNPGKGAFTRFLDKYEPQYKFFMENVFNPRLPAYLERRGYVQVNEGYPPCYIKK